MGARIAGPVAVWILAAAGCRPPVEAPSVAPAAEPPKPAPVIPPVVRVDAPAAAPVSPRYVTPANPDVPPLPSVLIQAKGRAVRRDLGGGWRATLEPAEITAAPGDELEFSLELRNSRPGSGRPELHAEYHRSLRWPLIKQKNRDDPAEWLPLQGGRTPGVLLASPPEWARGSFISIEFRQRQRPGSLGYATMNGPRLKLDNTTIVPVQVRRFTGPCDLPDGLAVTVAGRQITATFAKPISSSDAVSPLGEFVVRRISGRLTLVGFVEVYYSDFPMGAGPKDADCPQFRDNAFTVHQRIGGVEAQFTAPEPGPIDVVIFASNTVTGGPRHATAVLVE